jgi:excisionase family DNA binding protein
MNAAERGAAPVACLSGGTLERHYVASDLVAAGIARNERAVWAWVRAGRLRALRVGRSVRISESALREFLVAHTATGDAR